MVSAGLRRIAARRAAAGGDAVLAVLGMLRHLEDGVVTETATAGAQGSR